MLALNASLPRGRAPRTSGSTWISLRHPIVAAVTLAWVGAACSSLTDVDPTTDRIEVSPATVTLEVGRSATLSAEAFDENGANLTYGTIASGLPVIFDWTSRNGAYVEVDPSGQTVTVRALQEYVDGGSTGWSTVEARVRGRSQPVGTARVQVRPVSNIQVSPSPIEIQVGETVNVVAEATISTGEVVTVPTTWSIQDPSLASQSGAGGSNTTAITGVAAGETTLTATMGTKVSSAVTVVVTDAPESYVRTRFATVDVPVEIDFDLQGNLFVGSNAVDSVRIVRVTPDGNASPFGEKVIDPDALIVDKNGVFSEVGAGGVLVSGADDSQYTSNHVTGIKADGSGNVVLIQSAPPLLSNPSSFAFLSDGTLLVANYGNSTVSVLGGDGSGGYTLDLFYTVPAGGDGLSSMVAAGGSVYVRTGSQTIVELDESGDEVRANLWPAEFSGQPGALAVDVKGDLFDGDLLAAEAGPLGRIHRMDRTTRTWSTVGNLVFEFPIFGMAVSPVDGALYVAEREGQIWRVTAN